MKESVIIKKVNTKEVEKIFCSSLKIARKRVNEEKQKLTDEQKEITKFIIKDKA